MTRTRAIAAALIIVAGTTAAANVAGITSNPVQVLTDLSQIRQEGLIRSQVMQHLFWLTDMTGPRPAASAALRRASDWTRQTLTTWGLDNVHVETFDFGDAWTMQRFSLHLIAPYEQVLIGLPRYWSPATNGLVQADVVLLNARSQEDLVPYRGKLRGKVVLLQPPRSVPLHTGPFVLRMGPAELAESLTTPLPFLDTEGIGASFRNAVETFLVEEGAAAALERGTDETLVPGGADFMSWRTQRLDGGTVFPGVAGSRNPQAARGVPSATVAVEHYNQLARLAARQVPIRVELEIRTTRAAAAGTNTVAEIPGTELGQEVVMLGAHLDSMHGGTGATDNAAGVAAVLEAIRILRATGVRPRRTIRIALWDGEEHGLSGSTAYVTAHFSDRQTRKLLPEYKNLYLYFNVDNGGGRVRGIWAQGNLGSMPILQDWIAPLKDLGVDAVGPRSVGGSDHLSFEAVGLPGFQVMQDRLEYNSITHHSNMDVFDHVRMDDMAQLATVIASLTYQASVDDRAMPRKGFPPKPLPSK